MAIKNLADQFACEKPKVCMVGLGFVGLTLSLVLCEDGFPVLGVDKRLSILDSLKNKKPPFYERGLFELLEKQLQSNFTFTESIPADKTCDIYIIAVGTLVDANNQPSFAELESAARDIGQVLKKGDLVVLRSTVPIGTTRGFVIPLLEKHSNLKISQNDFDVVFAPERTVEGEAINELRELPQIIGGYNKEAVEKALPLFNSFSPRAIVVDSLEEAEMVKMVNNSYRDLIFAFANELVLICDYFNIDTERVIAAANAGYARSNVPRPSPGVGGYCLTKDPYLLAYSTIKAGGYEPLLPFASRRVNSSMPFYLANKIKRFLGKHYPLETEKQVGILGFAFKGNPPTSDVRFSPTLDLVKLLRQDNSIEIYGHDYLVDRAVFAEANVHYEASLENLFVGKCCVVIMIDHPNYRALSIDSLLVKTRRPVLFVDPWKLYNLEEIIKLSNVFYANLGYSNF